MRKEDQLRLQFGNKRLQRVDVRVRGIGLERRPFQVVYLLNLEPCQFLGQRSRVQAGQYDIDRPARLFANRLCSGQSLKRNPVQLSFPLLRYDQDPIGHLELGRAAAQVSPR